MLQHNIERILMLYNLVDDICIIDKDGYIVYAETFLDGAYSFDLKEIIGSHLFDVYVSSNEESSNMYKVIKTEKPILNHLTTWTTFKGDTHTGIVDTLPIIEDGVVVGAVEIAKIHDVKKNNHAIYLKSKKGIGQNRNYTLDDIITKDEKMISLKELIKKAAKTDMPILICGDTGTGKELVAQAIHSSSDRKRKPFISQNCAAIPGNLLESILFGTEKGGFTGAENKLGIFQLATGGTLFLDEINSMDIESQGKILKAIEEQKIMKIGGQEYVPVDVRIICACNEDPFDSIRIGNLRKDLFYRISAITLDVPSLHERRSDIELLVEYFLNQLKNDNPKMVREVDKETMECLKAYSWPGNIRELKNVVEAMCHLTDDRIITISDIPKRIYYEYQAKKHVKEMTSLDKSMLEFERAYIAEIMKKSSNKVEAAKKLNISKQLLNYKLNKLNIKRQNG